MEIVYSKLIGVAGAPPEASTIKSKRHKKQPGIKPKSIYTLMREERFKRAFLRKHAAEIAEIQQHFPGWLPNLD